jgi:hypothetical protein
MAEPSDLPEGQGPLEHDQKSGETPPSDGDQTTPRNPPPWGDDFQPERAWNTISTLRHEVRELKLDKTAREREKMSELERTQSERDEARKELEHLRLESLRTQVGMAKGLSPEALSFLTGTTQEELEANADKLKSLVGNGGPPPPPDYGAGARPPAGNGLDDSQSFSAVLRRAAGRA